MIKHPPSTSDESGSRSELPPAQRPDYFHYLIIFLIPSYTTYFLPPLGSSSPHPSSTETGQGVLGAYVTLNSYMQTGLQAHNIGSRIAIKISYSDHCINTFSVLCTTSFSLDKIECFVNFKIYFKIYRNHKSAGIIISAGSGIPRAQKLPRPRIL